MYSTWKKHNVTDGNCCKCLTQPLSRAQQWTRVSFHATLCSLPPTRMHKNTRASVEHAKQPSALGHEKAPRFHSRARLYPHGQKLGEEKKQCRATEGLSVKWSRPYSLTWLFIDLFISRSQRIAPFSDGWQYTRPPGGLERRGQPYSDPSRQRGHYDHLTHWASWVGVGAVPGMGVCKRPVLLPSPRGPVWAGWWGDRCLVRWRSATRAGAPPPPPGLLHTQYVENS